jgi:hypothetical protein
MADVPKEVLRLVPNSLSVYNLLFSLEQDISEENLPEVRPVDRKEDMVNTRNAPST